MADTRKTEEEKGGEMTPQRVLVAIPADFRKEPMVTYGPKQLADAKEFCQLLRQNGHEVGLIEEPLSEPTRAFGVVARAVESFKPTRAILRCYLWADPPNGHAFLNAVPADVPLGISAYIAATDRPDAILGEAPGEVFQFHLSCAAHMVGREHTRLFGPLTGVGCNEAIRDLDEFVEFGEIKSDVNFKSFTLPITPEHTSRAKQILDSMRGKLVAMTGGHCMGMHPLHINVPFHCGTDAWGLNIPIVSPDLFEWDRRFNARRDHYMSLGRHYVTAMVAKGFQFHFQNEWDGTPMPSDELDYNPEVAALQMGLYAAMLDITAERHISILGIPAQLVMTDGLVCGDLLKGVAMSSWGPEGRNHPLLWMTEGDVDAGISSLVLHSVTGKPAAFADVRCFAPNLGAWKMVNSGAACADLAENGWKSCRSYRQYRQYFRAQGGGGTFTFAQPKRCHVVGLRTGIDRAGIYATIMIGRTVQDPQQLNVVDGRWPQLNIEVFNGERATRFMTVTNHNHWSESYTPIRDACVLHEVVSQAGGRVKVCYDGRSFSHTP